MTTGRWIIASNCFAAFVVMGITSSIIGPTLPNLSASLALPIVDAGILRATQQVGMLVATLIGGYLLDRRSPKTALIPGMFFMASGLLGVVATGNLAFALAALLFVGAGTGFLNLGSNVAIASMFEKRASSLLSALHTFFGLGLFVGPLIAERALIRADKWKVAYVVPVLGCVVTGAAFAFMRMEHPARPRNGGDDAVVEKGVNTVDIHAGGVHAGGVHAVVEKSVHVPSGNPVRLLPLLPLILLLFTYVGAGNGIADWMPTHLQLTAHASPARAARVTSLYGLMITSGRAVGIVTLGMFGNMRVLAAGVATSAVGASLILAAGSRIPMVASGVALVGLGFSPIYPAVVAIGAEQQPENRGAVTGIVTGISSLGGMIIPVVQGWAGQGRSGGMIVIFFSTLVMALSLLMIHLIGRAAARSSTPAG